MALFYPRLPKAVKELLSQVSKETNTPYAECMKQALHTYWQVYKDPQQAAGFIYDLICRRNKEASSVYGRNIMQDILHGDIDEGLLKQMSLFIEMSQKGQEFELKVIEEKPEQPSYEDVIHPSATYGHFRASDIAECMKRINDFSGTKVVTKQEQVRENPDIINFSQRKTEQVQPRTQQPLYHAETEMVVVR